MADTRQMVDGISARNKIQKCRFWTVLIDKMFADAQTNVAV